MDFEELSQQTQDNLTKFLSVEIELAQTMYDMSETARTPDHRARLLENVRKAIQAIHHFEGRIADASVRKELNRKVSKLEKFCSEQGD